MTRMRSLLEELDRSFIEKDKVHIIESRAQHVLASAINLMEFIASSYTAEEAEELERKFLNAIRHKDQGKFTRSLRKKE
jgi:hypothetical protein